MDILILLTLIGFFLISLCMILHCIQHFHFRFCIKYKYRMTSSLPSTRNNIKLSINNNRETPPISMNNQHLRVSNSMNRINNINNKKQIIRHHHTNSSLYDNRFITSISSFRGSLHSLNNPDGLKLIKRKCQFCLYGVDEDFDFFPAAFLFYIIFIICIVLLIWIRFILINNINNNSIFYLLFNDNNNNNINFNIFWYLFISKLNEYKLNTMTSFKISQYFAYYGSIDWIIAYCIMILSVWESLFNFYRFYTTMYAAKYFYTIETKQVFKKYCYYFIIYSFIFLCNIHIYYWLFPITILTHFIFNIYCTWMFAHILVVQYKHIISTDSFLTDVHDEMLSSVYLMRKFSMFSLILSSIYIAIFVISYDMQIIQYLPILWSISSVSFTLNFVRNRQFILKQFYKIKHCLIIKNFSISSSTIEFKDKMFHSQRNNNNLNIKESPKCLQSPTENGSIADLKRQRKINKDSNDKIHRLKLHNDSTLSTVTTITGHTLNIGNNNNINHNEHQSLPPMMKNVINASTIDTLPTLKERGITLKQISMISEISNDTTNDDDDEEEDDDDDDDNDDDKENEEDEEDQDDDIDDDESIINEDDNHCLAATPSSDITKASSNSPILPHSPLMSDEMRYNLNNKKNIENIRLHKISITAPETIVVNNNNNNNNNHYNTSNHIGFRRKNIMIPNPIRTRSATLNTPSQQTMERHTNSFSEHSAVSIINTNTNTNTTLSDEDNGFITSPSGQNNGNITDNITILRRKKNKDIGLALPLQKTRSDNFVGNTPNHIKTDIDNNNEIKIGETKHFSPYQNMQSQPNHRNYKFDLETGIFNGCNNGRNGYHGFNGNTGNNIKSCGHTPQSNMNEMSLWHPIKEKIAPIDLTIDDNKYDGDNDEDDDNDNNDDNTTKPNTPSRKRKALELLGISSNESSTPNNFNHSFSYNANATFSRRNNLRNYSSYSSNKSKSKKKKKRNNNIHSKVPDGNPSFGVNGKQLVLTQSTSQHDVKRIMKKTMIKHHKSSNINNGKKLSPKKRKENKLYYKNGTQSNGHTPQSMDGVGNTINNNTPNSINRGWFFDYNPSPHSMHSKHRIINNPKSLSRKHEYYRSEGVEMNNLNRNYSENTSKSFSKTLTQSELRDIVYEENDVILMEAIKQQLQENKDSTQSDIGNSPNGINIMEMLASSKHTYSNSGSHQHNNTIFVSNSYHRDNVLNTNNNNNNNVLSKRIFELLAVDNNNVLYDDEDEEEEDDNMDINIAININTSSVPPKTNVFNNNSFDESEILDLRKAFSLPNNDKNRNNKKDDIDIHYACNEIEESDEMNDDNDNDTYSRLKLIGIPSQIDDVIIDIGKIQEANKRIITMNKKHQNHKKNKSNSSRSRYSNHSKLSSNDENKLILPDLDSSDDDDETLNTEMLTFDQIGSDINNINNINHDRNETNITFTYHPEESIKNNDKLQHDDDNNNNNNNNKDEEEDFFPSPDDFNMDNKSKKNKHHSSRSLLDELGRFTGIFHQSSKHSISFSSKSNKSNKSNKSSIKCRKLTNESIKSHKRRSRSMPSIDAIDELNNDSNDSFFDDTNNDDEEHGDIVSLLSVLVQHGFYSKTNLNSVQQLTHYNAKQ